jgi:hypothetical protein
MRWSPVRSPHIDGIPQKEPYFLPPNQRVGHRKKKVLIDSRPRLDRDVHVPPTPLLSHPSPAIAGHGRNSCTNQSGAQSPCRPRIGLRRPQYAESPMDSKDAAPSHRTTVASSGVDVKAHQILAHRTPCMARRIPH